MKTKWGTAILVVLALRLVPRGALGLCCGDCNDDGVVTVDEILTAVNSALNGCPVTPITLPPVPVVHSALSAPPQESDHIVVGMSSGIDVFEPLVQRLEMMQDDGTLEWVDFGRRVSLACLQVLPANSANPAVAETYLTERPRILHRRYWRRLGFWLNDPGASHVMRVSVTSGQSVTNTESSEFSQTIGVDVQTGGTWGAFSASVEASYQQTSTYSQVKSVTFETETTFEREDTCTSSALAMCVQWQLVDEFLMADAHMVPIHESDTLRHVVIDEQPIAVFPSANEFAFKVTPVAPD